MMMLIRYTWKKNGRLLDLSLSKYERLRDEGGSFVIKNPTDDDEGVYQCFAKNQYGTAMTVKTTLKKASRWRVFYAVVRQKGRYPKFTPQFLYIHCFSKNRPPPFYIILNNSL